MTYIYFLIVVIKLGFEPTDTGVWGKRFTAYTSGDYGAALIVVYVENLIADLKTSLYICSENLLVKLGLLPIDGVCVLFL